MRPNRKVLPRGELTVPSGNGDHQPTPGQSGWGSRLILVAGLWLLAGCQQSDPIREYAVAKPPAPQKAAIPERQARPAEMPAPPTRNDPSTDRILAAILPQGETMWFVKVQGPVDTTRQAVESFLKFVRSIDFAEGKPSWTLPDTWKEAPNPEGKGRFATLAVPVENENLELTVTELKSPGNDIPGYLLANINRWRGQLQQPPYELDQLERATIPVKTETGHTAWLVNIEGWLPGSKPKAPSAPKLPFAYKVPDHWQVGALRTFQLAAWNVTGEDRKATVTISTAGGDLVGNIQRWRDQVGLPRVEGAEVQKSIQEVKMGQATGKYVVLHGPAGKEQPQAILGVIVSALGEQWFFKMQGDAPLVQAEQANFEAFVQSVQFP